MPTEEPNPERTERPSPVVSASTAGVPPSKQNAQTLDFVELHRPALERDEVTHNVILANLDRLAIGRASGLRRWTLGAAGACAVQSPGYPIVLGELTQAQCRALADETRGPRLSWCRRSRGDGTMVRRARNQARPDIRRTYPAADSRVAGHSELSRQSWTRTGDRNTGHGAVCRLDHRLPT